MLTRHVDPKGGHPMVSQIGWRFWPAVWGAVGALSACLMAWEAYTDLSGASLCRSSVWCTSYGRRAGRAERGTPGRSWPGRAAFRSA